MNDRLIRPLAATRLLAGLAAALMLAPAAHAQTLAFAQGAYSAARGETLVLVTALSAPVPNGLEGYSLRLSFPAGVLTLGPANISVPAALNYDLFGPGAARSVSATTAVVSGFVNFGAPAYSGTAFAVYTVTIPASAPLGIHTLSLHPHLAGGNSFVDGLGNGIDTVLVFGSATLEVTGSDDPLPPPPLSITRQAGNLRLSFPGLAGRTYTLERSTNLTGWTDLQGFAPAADGTVEYSDAPPAPGQRSFYRLRTP